MTTMLTRSDAAALLSEKDRFLILTHRRPDGDTVGSAAALCRGLRQLGKCAWVAENPEVTEKYRPYLYNLTKPAAEEGDFILSVDVASPGMLPEAFGGYAGRIALSIDHHGVSTPTAPLLLADPQAAACGEIIYDVLALLRIRLEKELAEALYVAVSTDTGCFRYANTTAHTLEVAARCTEAGADIYPINQTMFDTNSFARLKIQGWIVENIRFYAGGKLAVAAIPREVESRLGVDEDDMENISGFPRSIEGVCMAATIRETGDGQVKMSVRAVPGFDAAAVCARFGGGGHKGAAGASMNLPLEKAAKAVAEAMTDLCGNG